MLQRTLQLGLPVFVRDDPALHSPEGSEIVSLKELVARSSLKASTRSMSSRSGSDSSDVEGARPYVAPSNELGNASVKPRRRVPPGARLDSGASSGRQTPRARLSAGGSESDGRPAPGPVIPGMQRLPQKSTSPTGRFSMGGMRLRSGASPASQRRDSFSTIRGPQSDEED